MVSDRRSTHERPGKESPGKAKHGKVTVEKSKSAMAPKTADKAIGGQKLSEIQVIELEATEAKDATQDKERNGGSKLLSQRAQKKQRLLLETNQCGSRTGKKVPLDAISCISDYSVISNIDYAPKVNRRRREGASTPLTSKSLKDFTNSPEGKCAVLHAVWANSEFAFLCLFGTYHLIFFVFFRFVRVSFAECSSVVLFCFYFCAVPCRAVQCRAVPCRAVPCSAVPYSAVQCSAVPCRAVQCSAMPCRTMPYRFVQCRAVQCSAVPFGAVSCRAMQCSAVPCRAVPYSVVACCGVFLTVVI